jgi:hypothetical protein
LRRMFFFDICTYYWKLKELQVTRVHLLFPTSLAMPSNDVTFPTPVHPRSGSSHPSLPTTTPPSFEPERKGQRCDAKQDGVNRAAPSFRHQPYEEGQPSDCHGFQNPPGFMGRVCRVRVRVGLCRPSLNPYPQHGLPGYPHCDPSHQWCASSSPPPHAHQPTSCCQCQQQR